MFSNTDVTLAKVRDLEMSARNGIYEGYLPLPTNLFDWILQEKLRFPEATTVIIDPNFEMELLSSTYYLREGSFLFGLKVEFKPLQGLILMLRKDIKDED